MSTNKSFCFAAILEVSDAPSSKDVVANRCSHELDCDTGTRMRTADLLVFLVYTLHRLTYPSPLLLSSTLFSLSVQPIRIYSANLLWWHGDGGDLTRFGGRGSDFAGCEQKKNDCERVMLSVGHTIDGWN